MTNQKLKAHCEDVIANPQDHLDWVVDMARVALASLEAVPVAYTDAEELETLRNGTYADMFTPNEAYKADPLWIPLYAAPPAPELKLIDLPVMQVDNPIDGFFYKCDEVISAIRAAGYEVKSS